jgi:hypothetical protein
MHGDDNHRTCAESWEGISAALRRRRSLHDPSAPSCYSSMVVVLEIRMTD